MELEDASETLKECVREFDQTFAKFYIKDENKGRPGSDDGSSESSEKEEPTPPKGQPTPPFEIPIVQKPKKHSKQKLKKLYKTLSRATHPDKGGDDEDFLLVGKFYEDGNLLELIRLAEKYNIEYEVQPDDEEIMNESVKKLEHEIFRIKDTLAWNWVKGNLQTKLNVIRAVEKETNRKINPNDLIDELRDKSQKPKESPKLLN